MDNPEETNNDLKIVSVFSDGEIKEESVAEKNINRIKKELKFNDHPNPTIIIIIITLILLVIYYIYIIFIKTNFSGIWYDNNHGSEFIIEHNRFTDNINLNLHDSGFVKNNVIYINLVNNEYSLGILHNNNIYWIGTNNIWRRAIKMR